MMLVDGLRWFVGLVGVVGIGAGGWRVVRWHGMACAGLSCGSGFADLDGVAAGWDVEECFRTALEDILHDVGRWFALVCWFRL